MGLTRITEGMLGFNNANQEELDAVSAQLADIAINVKSFGAKGDGITDDSTAIQNAINSLTNGGTVLFPVGSYLVNTALVGKIGVSLRGHGGNSGAQAPQKPNVTIKTTTLTTGNLLTFGASGDTGEGNLIVEGIRFVAELDAKDLPFGIQNYWKNVVIQDNSFVDFKEGVKTNAVQTWIVRNYASSCNIAFDISATECHVLNNHTFSSGTEILLRDSGNICIGNKAFGDGSSGQIGIECWGSNCLIIGNYMDAFENIGIYIKGNGSAIEGTVVQGNATYGIGNAKTINAGIYVDAQLSDVKGCIISDNTVGNKRADRSTVDGIRINAATGYSADGTVVTNNSVRDVTGQKIRKSGAGTLTNIIIENNNGYKTENYGTITAKNGDLIAHGLAGIPKIIVLQSADSSTYTGTDSYDATNFRVLARNSDGTLVSTAKTFYFWAKM